MRRVLLTGMSGTGKSTLIQELAARGYRAVDLDDAAGSEWVPFVPIPGIDEGTELPEREWVWREARVRALLAEETDLLFVSGCASNMGKFRAQFEQIILLSAPAAVIAARLATRTNNRYGKQPEELAQVMHHLQTVEPRLRQVAHHEIDTNAPLHQVVERLLRLVLPHRQRKQPQTHAKRAGHQ